MFHWLFFITQCFGRIYLGFAEQLVNSITLNYKVDISTKLMYGKNPTNSLFTSKNLADKKIGT
jgi:hypothetical protein